MDKKCEMAVRSYAEAINIIKHHQWQYEVTVACPGTKIMDKSLGTILHIWCFWHTLNANTTSPAEPGSQPHTKLKTSTSLQFQHCLGWETRRVAMRFQKDGCTFSNLVIKHR